MSGRDDVAGNDVAVAGFYDEGGALHCPSSAFGPYDLVLENNCRAAVFVDSLKNAHACVPLGQNGSSCTIATSPTPVFTYDSLGTDWNATGDGPDPLVVIGHFADPRLLQCTPDDQARCQQEFVADAVVWADGHPVEPTAPRSYDSAYNTLNPRMSLDDLRAALGSDHTIVSANASAARDVRLIDPGWNMAGDQLMWVVRTISSSAAPMTEMSPVTVWLVDDATGAMVDHHPLGPFDGTVSSVWFSGAHHGLSQMQDNWSDVDTLLTVTTQVGDVVWHGLIGGSKSGTDEDTTVSGPDVPLVLYSGTYKLDASTVSAGGSVAPGTYGDCSTTQTIGAAQRIEFAVDFAKGQPCTWSGPLTPSFTNY